MTHSTTLDIDIEEFFQALGLRHLERCQAIAERLQTSPVDATDAAWGAYFAGILANEQEHDPARAEQIFRHLLANKPDVALRGRVQLALGRTLEYQGQWTQALDIYEAALATFVELDQTIDQVKTWKQMAIVCAKGFANGDFGVDALNRAIDHCQRALVLLEETVDASPDVRWLEGSICNTLGLVYRDLGQWDEAIASYERDLAICRALDDRFGTGLTYGNLGEIHLLHGPEHWSAALDAFQTALTIVREFEHRAEEIEVLANLGFLHQQMDRPGEALGYYEDALTVAEMVRAGITSEEARAGFFATIADVYANAVLAALAVQRPQQAFAIAEQARARAFLDRLSARSPELARAMSADTVTLDQVQIGLPSDGLLLAYFTTGLEEERLDRLSSRAGVRRHRFPPPRTLLFAVTHDAFQVYELDLSPNDLRPRHLNNVVARHFLHPSIRRTLYDHLIAPVETHLTSRRRVYIVPHGPLHYLPFASLLAPDGETLLRENGPHLVQTPSATLLLENASQQVVQPERACLALGYNGEGMNQLRHGEQEARRVAEITGGDSVVGAMPKSALLAAESEHYRLLHISCHGQFDPTSPLASALHTAPDETLTALDILQSARLRCDLVCLSACESGLSRVHRGDELMGLVRAFRAAGASSLLVSLWRVDERSTYLLMERFYQAVQTGVDFAHALHRAQVSLRGLTRADLATHPLGFDTKEDAIPEEEADHPFADPYYWAGFVLIGNLDPW